MNLESRGSGSTSLRIAKDGLAVEGKKCGGLWDFELEDQVQKLQGGDGRQSALAPGAEEAGKREFMTMVLQQRYCWRWEWF